MRLHPLPSASSPLPGVPSLPHLAPSTQSLLIDAYSKVKQHRTEAIILQQECRRMLDYYPQLMMVIVNAILSLQLLLPNPIELDSTDPAMEILQQLIQVAATLSSTASPLNIPADQPFISGLVYILVNRFITIYNLNQIADKLLSPHLCTVSSTTTQQPQSATSTPMPVSESPPSLLDIADVQMDSLGYISGINDEQLIDAIDSTIIQNDTNTDSSILPEPNADNIDNMDDIVDIHDLDDMMKLDRFPIGHISSIILDKSIFDVLPRYLVYLVIVPPTAPTHSTEPIITTNPINVQNVSSLSHLLPLDHINNAMMLLGGRMDLKVSFDSVDSFDATTLEAMKTIHQIKNVSMQVSSEVSWFVHFTSEQYESIEYIKSVLWSYPMNHCL